MNIVDINRTKNERHRTIVDNHKILWLNKKHIEDGQTINISKKLIIHRKNRYKLVDQPKKQCNRIFIDEKLAIKVIMDFKTTLAHIFRARLGFKQYDVILMKEQSVLRKIRSSSEGENMQTQYNVLSYRIDFYFHEYKPAIEIDENGYSDRNIDYKTKRQKRIEQELACKFIRIDSDKEDLDVFRTINEIFRHIKQSTQTTLAEKI